MLFEYKISTKKEGFYDITHMVEDALYKSKAKSGTATVYCPHTTGGITINEHADPDVVKDLTFAFKESFPDRKEFMHYEGNSAAHLKASVIGVSENIIVEKGRLVLGTWQGIYFAEFDGPRNRKFFVKIMEG